MGDILKSMMSTMIKNIKRTETAQALFLGSCLCHFRDLCICTCHTQNRQFAA